MSSRLEIEPEDRPASEAASAPRHGQVLRAALLMIAVAALAGGSWWAGHSDKPVAPDASAVPEIHPDTAPVKEAPADRGGMVVPDQDSVLLNHDAKAQPEELLPPPEALKPRPVAPASPSPASALPQAMTSAPPPVSPLKAPPPQIATAPAPPPPAVVAPAPKAVPPPASAAAGGYRLQLGALKTEDAAKAQWQKLQKQEPDLLGKLSLSISRVDLGAKGVYYRMQAGPIGDVAEAAQDCAALKSRNIGCILVKP